MKIEEVVNFYDNTDKKIEEAKKYMHNILGKEYETKLRILDPRINHYEFYGEITKEDWDTIAKIYPNAQNIIRDDGTFECIKVIDEVGFTIYNVNDLTKKDLIKTHDEEYQKQLENNKDVIY